MFGERLKKLRKSVGVSQQELASILGLTKACISQYENNTRTPSIEVLVEIANYFEVSVDYLLGNVLILNKNNTGVKSLSTEELNLIKFLRKKNINVNELIHDLEEQRIINYFQYII